jgi:hypothetical protein
MSFTKSKIQILTAFSVILVLLNLGLIGFFVFNEKTDRDRPERNPPPRDNHPKEIMIKRLGLESSQITEYEKLIEAHQQLIRVYNDSIHEAKKQLFFLLQPNQKSQADSVINVLAKLQGSVEQAHYNHFVDLRAICNPDQTRKFDLLTKEMAQIFAPDRKRLPPPRD